MDLQDIWQEHRRWILGVLAGVVVFFAARSILDGVFGGQGAVNAALAARNSLMRESFYQPPARDRILAEHDALVEQVATLRDALGFVPGEAFTLTGKGEAEIYFPAVEARVRSDVLRAAQEAGVELADEDLAWPAPVGREEIERSLIGLAAIETAALRLVQAGERVRASDPDTLGLVSIESLKFLDRPGGPVRSYGVRSRGRQRTAGSSDLVREYRVKFAVRCDVQTLQVWLESLRGESPPLALAPTDFIVQPGDQPGDPLLVKGDLLALIIDEPTDDR